jgi:RNA polymerase sigma-70 factor (ECF subfamily)
MRDAELVADALLGDTEAFAGLVARHRARVEAVVERLVRAESEDVVQDAVLRAFVGLSELRDRERFGAWLCAIAVNVAKMRLRRREVESRRTPELASAGGLEDRVVLSLVRDAVDVLPRGQREVVLMHYVDDLSCDEIASMLGVTPGAVRVRLHRAREQLRDELAILAPTPKREEEIAMIGVAIDDVVVRVAPDDPETLAGPQRILLLGEVHGDRRLPIWVGAPEGDALAFRLWGAHLRRRGGPRGERPSSGGSEDSPRS